MRSFLRAALSAVMISLAPLAASLVTGSFTPFAIAQTFGTVNTVGTPNYSASQQYYANNVVVYNGAIYIALQNGFSGQTPARGSAYWGGGDPVSQQSSTTAAGTQNQIQVAGAGGTLGAGPDVRSILSATRPYMVNWLTALSKCNSQVVNIRAFGDSRMEATFSDLPFGSRWVDLIRTQAAAYGCPSHGTGLVPTIGTTNLNSPGLNIGWAHTTGGFLGFDSGASAGPKQNGTNGYSVAAVAVGEVLTFTSTIPFDHVVTHCEANGTWVVSVNGTQVGTCGTNGSGGSIAAVSSAFSLATNTVTYTCTVSSCGIYGAEGTAGSVGVSVHNMAVGSSTAAWWGANPSSELAFSDLIGEHDLDIIEDIANEPGIGYTPTQTQTNLTNLIQHEQAFSPAPSMLMIAPMQDGISGQGPFYTVLSTVANATGIDYIDFRQQVGTAQVAGLYESDTYHENKAGNLLEFSMVEPIIFPTSSIPGTGTGGTGVASQSCGSQFVTGFDSVGHVTCGTPAGTTQSAGNGTCGNGFTHYASIMVPSSSVSGGANLTNYPMMVAFNGATTNSLTLATLKTAANGGQVQSNSGLDVIFCTAASGGTQLSHELVSGTFVPSTGAGLWYVKAPTLSASTSNTIYMFYGTSGASDTSNVHDVWSNGYAAVYHTANGAYTTDSTSNGNTLTLFGAVSGASTLFGSGLAFGASNYAYVNTPVNFPTGTASRALEAWILHPTTPTSDNIDVGWGDGTTGGPTAFAFDNKGASGWSVWNATSNVWTAPTDTTTWHYYAVSSAGTTSSGIAGYLDGAAESGSGADGSTLSTVGTQFRINGIPNFNGNAAGSNEQVTEVRVSTSPRTAGYFGTTYANLHNVATFMSVTAIQ